MTLATDPENYRKPAGERSSSEAKIRVSRDVKDRIVAAAEAAGVGLTQFIIEASKKKVARTKPLFLAPRAPAKRRTT